MVTALMSNSTFCYSNYRPKHTSANVNTPFCQYAVTCWTKSITLFCTYLIEVNYIKIQLFKLWAK